MTAGMEIGFKKAVARIKSGLKEDPRTEKVLGIEGARDYLFTDRVVEWISKLAPNPSEPLLIAAWGHILYRWRIPRETYPMTTIGYHKWRTAQSKLSADETEKIVKEAGYDEKTIARIRELVLKTTFPEDPESRVLEDADCLAFLELKFESYIPEWDEGKYVRILKGTLEKMTSKAKELALTISYSKEGRRLLEKALT